MVMKFKTQAQETAPEPLQIRGYEVWSNRGYEGFHSTLRLALGLDDPYVPVSIPATEPDASAV